MGGFSMGQFVRLVSLSPPGSGSKTVILTAKIALEGVNPAPLSEPN